MALVGCGGASRGDEGWITEVGGAAATAGRSQVGGEGASGSSGASSEGTAVGGGKSTGAGVGGESTGDEGDAGAPHAPPGDVFCPSLELAPDRLLFVSRTGRELTLLQADGAVFLRHTLPFDDSVEAFFRDDTGLLLAAVQYDGSLGGGERAWQLARFDATGALLGSAQGVLPSGPPKVTSVYPPVVRRRGESVALEQTDGDTWVVGLDGTALLRECEQHSSLGDAEEPGWIGVHIRTKYGEFEAALVEEETGACRRVDNNGSSATLFLHGRFQYMHGVSGVPVLTDEGPSSSSNFPLSTRDPNGPSVTLHAVSDDVLYVLAPPEFARYDVAAREFAFIALPAAARTFGIQGDRLVGYDAGLPVVGYDLVEQTAIAYELDAPAGAARSRTSEAFVLVSSDERPVTWLELDTGETRPFELSIPEDTSVALLEVGARGLVVAGGLPIAHFDLDTGVAKAIDLPRSSENGETLHDGDSAFVVLDGVPAFRVSLEAGEVFEVEGSVDVSGEARTERVGQHLLVSDEGRPRALLTVAGLQPLDGADQVPAAVALRSNERYIVGFDARNWPVFRLDVSSRFVESYAVSEPSDLVGFRDARYIETPGDSLYEQNYAPQIPDAQVLEDGSVAVALRDDRQGRLWLVTPEDTAFRPLGRPVTNAIGLNWSVLEHSFQISGDFGNCFCQPPVLRWESSSDPELLPEDSVQLVARAHPALVVVRDNFLIDDDPSGACVVEGRSPVPLVHDLVEGTTRSLQTVTGDVTFLAE